MSVRFIPSLIFLLAMCSTLARAQEIDIAVSQQGTKGYFVKIKAANASVLDIVSALAEKTQFNLSVASPDNTRVMQTTLLDVNKEQIDLLDLLSLLGTSCGLHFDTDSIELKIRIGEIPQPDDVGAGDFIRTRALDAILTAYGGDDKPENKVEFLLRSAKLYVAGGKMTQAYRAYQEFLEKFDKHPRVPEIILAAAEAAIKAGLDSSALEHVDQFLSDLPGHRDIGKALILGAHARLSKDDTRGARRLLETAIRKSLSRQIPERDGLIAEYYQAQLHHDTGDNEAAIKLLGELEWRHSAENNRDLLDQVWLYLGICKRASGNIRDAIHDLNLATYVNGSPQVRIRILLLSAATYLDLGNPFFALNAAKTAEALDPTGEQRFRAMVMQGAAHRALYLHDRAHSVLFKAVMESPNLIADEEVRLVETTKAMRALGEAYFEDSRFHDALKTFEAVLDAVIQRNNLSRTNENSAKDPRFSDAFIAELNHLIAQCHKRLGDYKAALATLDKITKGIGSEEFLKEIRRLRGDCFMKLGMYERAIKTWSAGDSR